MPGAERRGGELRLVKWARWRGWRGGGVGHCKDLVFYSEGNTEQVFDHSGNMIFPSVFLCSNAPLLLDIFVIFIMVLLVV